jgi:glycosyltransferase involved in cell wall biosynthesis
MRPSLFLVQKMSLGYGVSVVVDNIARRLSAQGWPCAVCCIKTDWSFSGYPVFKIKPNLKEINFLAGMLGNPVIVAHTSPFFELLPQLAERYDCLAWEHGDPTPDFFPGDDLNERIRIITNKRDNVYGNINGTIAISEFIRHDIDWPCSHVIYNGCNHAPDMGAKEMTMLSGAKRLPLRIGTLMRLGEGEAKYKGNDLFLELVAMLRSRAKVQVLPSVMGRGKAKDAEDFRNRGFEVYLNASEQEKWKFLRHLDVFVSPSLWEGFNLPLVEAQALGTVAIAFDTGSHPEVTPCVCSSLGEACAVIEEFGNNPVLLHHASISGYRFVRSNFCWEKTCEGYKKFLVNVTGHSDSEPHAIFRFLGIAPFGNRFCSMAVNAVNFFRRIWE